MAKRSGWSRTFKRDSQLQHYFLDQVVPTGKTLGVGSYGSVVEVQYSRVPCAAKRMHEMLLDPGNQGVRETVVRYQQECQLMAGLRHPNITQFLGLCFLEGSEVPLLVMEKLEMSVDDLLEFSPNVPLPVKISILTDTSSGLVYLHSRASPIVHRDLTARNVLLTSSLTAKITDMGNSRMVTLKPAQLAQTMSKHPGTTVYMPPEALSDSHRYGPSLDVFSFGHLALYVLTQVFPGDLLSATHADPDDSGRVIGRTEVERRVDYMKKLENHFLESHPVLVELVKNSLHNIPKTRPSAEQLLERLQPVQIEMERLHGGSLGRSLNVTSVLHMKETKEKNERIEELEISELRLETENRELVVDIARLENDRRQVQSGDLQQLIEEKRKLEIRITQLQADSDQLNIETHQLKTEKNQLKAENDHLKAENNQQTIENIQLTADKNQLKAENDQLKAENDQLKPENDSLKVENEHLKTDKNNLHMGNGQVRTENNQLKTENNQLKTEIDKHKLEIGQLNADINQFKKQQEAEEFQLETEQQEAEEFQLETEQQEAEEFQFDTEQQEAEEFQLETDEQQEAEEFQFETAGFSDDDDAYLY